MDMSLSDQFLTRGNFINRPLNRSFGFFIPKPHAIFWQMKYFCRTSITLQNPEEVGIHYKNDVCCAIGYSSTNQVRRSRFRRVCYLAHLATGTCFLIFSESYVLLHGTSNRSDVARYGDTMTCCGYKLSRLYSGRCESTLNSETCKCSHNEFCLSLAMYTF